MRECYKALGARGPAHFSCCSLYWATAAVGLISQLDSFQRLHDEEAGDSRLMGRRNSTPPRPHTHTHPYTHTHKHIHTDTPPPHQFSPIITKLPVTLDCSSPAKNTPLLVSFLVVFIMGCGCFFLMGADETVGFRLCIKCHFNVTLLCVHSPCPILTPSDQTHLLVITLL